MFRCDRCQLTTSDPNGFSFHMAEEAGYFLSRALLANGVPGESPDSVRMRREGLAAISTRWRDKHLAAVAVAEQTCEERIDGALAGRLATFRTLAAGQDVGDQDDLNALTDDQLAEITGYLNNDRSELTPDDVMTRAWDAAAELPLGVFEERLITVELSMGGPGDRLECRVDADGDVTRIEYVFLDWFDGARRTLDGDDFDVAERFVREVAGLAA